MRGALLVLLAVLGLVLGGCAGEPSSGSAARSLPDITLEAFDGGSSLDLSTVQGPAVINVWASWCDPCRRELPRYQSFAERYAGKVKVIGVDFQDTRTDKARSLIRRTGVRYPLYKDPDGTIRARALPQLLLVDAHGHVAFEKYVEITSVGQLETLVEKHLGVGS